MTKNPRYTFAHIPNNNDGRKFIQSLRTYLNDGRYTMRIRGQKIRDDLYGQGRATNIKVADSKFLRVYIDDEEI